MDKITYIRQRMGCTKNHSTFRHTGQVFIWLALLLFNVAASHTAYGQCCLTNSLNISTGYDPVAMSVVGAGASCTTVHDPRWRTTSISSDMSTAIGSTTSPCTPSTSGAWADVIQAYYVWGTMGGSNWISCFNNTQFTALPGTHTYNFVLSRQFTLCQAACVTFNFDILNDNFIDFMHVDGIDLSYSQPVSTAHYGTPEHFGTTVCLAAGTHTIFVSVNEDNAGGNPSGLNIHGTISTPAANIIGEGAGCTPSWPWCNIPPITGGPLSGCAGFSGSLSNAFTGGSWSSSNSGVVNINASTGSFTTGPGNGPATITYTDLCGRTTTTVINVMPLPVISSMSNTGPVCAGSNVMVNQVSSLSGGSITGYSWSGPGIIGSTSGPSIVAAPSSAPSALYTLIVTGSNGCTKSATNTVTVKAVPTVTLAPKSICVGQCTTLNATVGGGAGPVNYAWTPGGGTTAAITVCPTATTTYNVTVTPTSGWCPVTKSVTVTVNPVPSFTPTIAPTCEGKNMNLLWNGGGAACCGYTYSWSGPGGFTNAGANPIIVGATPSMSGVYTLTVTAPGGCSTTHTVNATVYATPFVMATSAAPICVGACTTMAAIYTYSGSGTVSYLWSPTGGTTSSISACPTTTTVYTVTATESLGSCSTSATITVIVNPIPVITGTLTVCENSTTSLTASVGGGTWTSIDTNVATVPSGAGSPVAVTGVAFGTADITYTSPAGCVQWTTVTVNPTPVASVSASPAAICAGFCTTLTATYTFTGSGSISYSWAPVSAVSSTISDCPGATTTYSVTVTESDWACNSTAATTVTVNPLPVVSGILEFCDGSTTTLTSSIGGDTWTSSDTTVATIPAGPSGSEVVTPVAPGTTVITDMSPVGCISTVTVTVDPTAFVTSVTAAPPTICAGDPTTLNVTYSGSIIPGITWSPGSMTGTPVVDFPSTTTTYSVTTSIGVCTSTGTVMVSVNPTPAIIGPTNLCLSSFVMLYPTIGGGTWMNMTPGIINVTSAVGDTVKVTGLVAGTGTIKYTLPTGCFAMITVTVFPTPAPVVTLNTPGTDPTVAPFAYRIDANGPCGAYTVQYMAHLNNWPATSVFPTQIMNSPGAHYSIYYDYPLNPPFPAPPYDFTLLLPTVTYPFTGYPGGWWGIYQVDLLNVSTIVTPQTPLPCACTWDISSTLTWKSAHPDNEPVETDITTTLSVIPNPTAGVFSISGTLQPGVKSTEIAIEVLDAVGRIIYTDVAAIDKGSINKKIALGNEIANGVYLIRVKNSEVSKVVKFTLER